MGDRVPDPALNEEGLPTADGTWVQVPDTGEWMRLEDLAKHSVWPPAVEIR